MKEKFRFRRRVNIILDIYNKRNIVGKILKKFAVSLIFVEQ